VQDEVTSCTTSEQQIHSQGFNEEEDDPEDDGNRFGVVSTEAPTHV